MSKEREIVMSEETAEDQEGKTPLTTSTLREVLDEVKKEGVSEKDFTKHPELRDEIFGANGEPAFKGTLAGDIPQVKPTNDPVSSMEGVVAPEKAHWADDHAKAVAGEKGNVPYIGTPLPNTPEEKISFPPPKANSNYDPMNDIGTRKISGILLRGEALRRGSNGK